MPAMTRAVGAGLAVLGLISFLATGADSPTALLPALLGLLLVGLGVLAGREAVRRHAMHAAMLLALLGLLGAAMNLTGLPDLFAGRAERPVAVVSSALTVLALAVYLVLGIRSFVEARRA